MFDPSLMYDVYAPHPIVSTTPTSPPESVQSFPSSSSDSGRLGKRKEREEAPASELGVTSQIASCFLREGAGLVPFLPPAPRLLPSPPPDPPPDPPGFALPPLCPASMMSEIGAALGRDVNPFGWDGASMLASPHRDDPEPDVATGSAPLAGRDFENEILAALSRPGTEAEVVEIVEELDDGAGVFAPPRPFGEGAGLMRNEVEKYGSLKAYCEAKHPKQTIVVSNEE